MFLISSVVLQLQRNILATNPRVTRFRIDWNDGENSENVPPTQIGGESNQMTFGSTADIMQKMAETSNSGFAMPITNGASNDKVVLGASSTDSNSMDVGAGGDTKPSTSEAEAMDM